MTEVFSAIKTVTRIFSETISMFDWLRTNFKRAATTWAQKIIGAGSWLKTAIATGNWSKSTISPKTWTQDTPTSSPWTKENGQREP